MSVFIKQASINDIPTIQNIAAITWAATYHFLSEGQLSYMMEMMYSNESLQKQMQEGHQFYLACETNQEEISVLGFTSVCDEKKEGIFKLHKLYVLPTAQKKGIGKLLIETAVEYCKQNVAKQLQLQVNRFNDAKFFYEKMGFAILYEADFNIGNGYFMNDYVMGLEIH